MLCICCFFWCCYILVISLLYNFFELILMVLLYNIFNDLRCFFGLIFESISIWGELIVLVEMIIFLLVIILCFMLLWINYIFVVFLFFIMICIGRIKLKIDILKIVVWLYCIMDIKLFYLIKSFDFYYYVCYNYDNW